MQGFRRRITAYGDAVALRSVAFLAVAVLVPVTALLALGSRDLGEHYRIHFWAVSGTMSAAGAAATALIAFGAAKRDRRAIVVGAAFAAMSALLMIHGLATPEVAFAAEGQEGPLAVAGALTLPVGAAVLATAGTNLVKRASVRALLSASGGLVVAMLALGALALTAPEILPREPAPASGQAFALLAVASALFAIVARRAWRTFALTHRPADLWVLVGICWLAVALAAGALIQSWHLGWWLGHVLETAGMSAIAIPVALDLRRVARSRPLDGDLSASELVEAEEQLLGAEVAGLMARLALKDESTEGHTRRVALLAVRTAEKLRLPPARMRQLAIGGLLHDMGKLQVPDAILKKPAALAHDEFAVIRRHPAWGDELTAHLGFGTVVRQLVRSHHERLDGCGYPDGIPASELPLEVRILTVCDVYDALVSNRVYREALSSSAAMAIIINGQGTAFDPVCVEGLLDVVGAEQELGDPQDPGLPLRQRPSSEPASAR